MLCAVIACNRESEEYHNDTGSSLTEEQALLLKDLKWMNCPAEYFQTNQH